MSDNKYEFPTEIIDLPSKGLIYPEGHPLRKGNVEIKYMTAREEDILASQSLIKKGVVLDKLFESVVVEKGVDINDIFIGDKNAILLATRVMGYGADYQVEVTDPFTLDEIEITKELQSLERLYKGKGEKSFDVTTRLKYMIQSVEGNSDRGYITKWVQNEFLALDTKSFRKYVRELSPDMDLKFEFTSEVTGEQEALDIPFGISFFYPTE